MVGRVQDGKVIERKVLEMLPSFWKNQLKIYGIGRLFQRGNDVRTLLNETKTW